MDCEKVVLDIQAWIDGELKPEGELELQKHLEQCSSCRSLADRMKAVRELVRRIPAPVPSAALDGRVMASFLSSHASANRAPARVPVRRSHGLWLSRPAMALMAAVIVIFGLTAFYLGWTLGQSQYEKLPPVPIDQSTKVERPGALQSETTAASDRSKKRVRGAEASGQASGTSVSLAGFQPILEPKVRIIGRQVQ